MSQEEQDYAQVVQDLQATLTLTVEAGGYDAQLARCVMLEAACLHGATLVPKQEATHLKRAMHNLKLACEIVAKRRALLQAAVDENTAPVGDLPPFVVPSSAKRLPSVRALGIMARTTTAAAETSQLRSAAS